MRRAHAVAVALAMAVAGAAASAQTLSKAGAALPPAIFAADAPALYAIDLAGDEVEVAHVLLQPANATRALMRDRDGFWSEWNGDPDALPATAVTQDGDRLTYKLFTAAPIDRLAAPYSIVLAYRVGGQLKFGAFQASVRPVESAP